MTFGDHLVSPKLTQWYHGKLCHPLGKFDLKNTVINIVAGLGLLSFITMFCDFILLNYVPEKKIVSLRIFFYKSFFHLV